MKMSTESTNDRFFRVICLQGWRIFQYTEEEWLKLCDKISYFYNLNNYRKGDNAAWLDDNERRTVKLSEIESNVYRYIDVYGRKGTFGDSVPAGVFLKILEAVDFFQIEGADEDLARVVNEGLVFGPGARNQPALSEDESTDDLFIKCTEVLWNSDRFISTQFTAVKRALVSLPLFFETRTDLSGRIPLFRVICSRGKEHIFQYTEEEWLQLCNRISYFYTLDEFRKGENALCMDYKEKRPVMLSEIDSWIYRYIDVYGRKGTFGDMVTAEDFLKILQAVDFFQIDGADEDLARAIDEGSVFYPGARKQRTLSEDKSMDDLFIECTEVLWNSDRFISTQFTEVKRAFADLTLFLDTRIDLFGRLPIGVIEHLLECPNRKFGLERDVFRVALIRCEKAGNLSDLVHLIQSFRHEWPPQNMSYFDGTFYKKVSEVFENLSRKWIENETRSFVIGEHAMFCRRMMISAEEEMEWTEMFEGANEALNKFFNTFVSISNISKLLHDMETNLRERARYACSSLFNCENRLYEYHHYVRQLRLLALPPLELEKDFEQTPVVYMVPNKSSGIWLISGEFTRYSENDRRSLSWGFRTDYFLPMWFINFNKSFPRARDRTNLTREVKSDIFEHYEWKATRQWTLPLELPSFNDNDDADSKIVISNGNDDESPLILIGIKHIDARIWTGYFLGHACVTSYLDLGVYDDIRVSHYSSDETHTYVNVIRLKDTRIDVARYLVDKNEWYDKIRRTDDPIELEHLSPELISVSKFPSALNITNAFDHVKLASTPSCLPLLIMDNIHLSFDENIGRLGFTLECAVLHERHDWHIFTIRFCDPEMPSGPLHSKRISKYDLVTTEKFVIIRNARLCCYPKMFEGRQLIIDVDNRKAWFQRLFKFDNANFVDKTEDEIKVSWKKHRPIKTSILPPNAVHLTDSALIPSSRTGFWVDLERDYRDNSDPYDIVNWRDISRFGSLLPSMSLPPNVHPII